MARAEYVRHVAGDTLTTGTVLVFREYFEMLGNKLGYVYRTDPLSGVRTKEKVKFRVRVYARDGSGVGSHVRCYRLGLSFPAGKLITD